MFLQKFGGQPEQREVAIVRDELHRRRIFVRIAFALDREVTAVADDVGVGQDPLAVDHEAGADAAADRAGVPGRAVIRLDLRGSNPDEGCFGFGR